MFTRSSGILLHPTSLPGKYCIGTLGEEAKKFIDFLEKSNQKLWQIFPLGPTGYGDSPYQCFSAFAGNPYLIDMLQIIPLRLPFCMGKAIEYIHTIPHQCKYNQQLGKQPAVTAALVPYLV